MAGAAFDVLDLAQFGFAAVAAAALWLFIKDLIPRLLTVIEQNASALQKAAEALEKVADNQNRNVAAMTQVAERLTRLEEQHRYGVRECPLIKERAKEAREDRSDK